MIDILSLSYPHAKIDFLVNKRVSELVIDYPNINKVHTIEKETAGEIRKICKEGEYDLAIIVYPRFSIALGVFLGKVTLRLGTKYRWYSFFFNIRHAQHRKHSIKHEMEYNLDLLSELKYLVIKDLKPHLKVSHEYLLKANKYLIEKEIDRKLDIITIHIPTMGSAKAWSNENFIKLIKYLVNHKLNIVLTGTQNDKTQINNIIEKIAQKHNIYVFTDLSLKELAALLKISKLFIGNSSGPIHIAAAVGTFVIGLYSPVIAEQPVRWSPVTDKKKIFVPENDDDGRDIMDDIKPEDVYDFVINYLKTGNSN